MGFKGKNIGDTKQPETFQREPTYFDELADVGRVLLLKSYSVGDVIRVRFLGNIFPHSRHWIESYNDPKKVFPMSCHRFDPDTETCEKEHDYDCLPCFCKIRASSAYFINLLNRNLIEEENCETAEALQLTVLGHNNIQDIHAAIDMWKAIPTDPKHGYDMAFSIRPSKKGGNFNREVKLAGIVSQEGTERTLTDEELELLENGLIDLEAVYQSLLPKRRDEIFSLFFHRYIDFQRAERIIDWSVENGRLQEDEVDSLIKSLNTVESKRSTYGDEGDEASRPARRSRSLPTPRRPSPKLPDETEPDESDLPQHESPGSEEVERLSKPGSLDKSDDKVFAKKRRGLIPPPPRDRL